MSHVCNQQANIAAMETKLKTHELILSGEDGRSGITKELIILSQNNISLNKTLKELVPEVRGLKESRIRNETEDLTNANRDAQLISYRRYLITSLIAVGGLLVAMIVLITQ